MSIRSSVGCLSIAVAMAYGLVFRENEIGIRVRPLGFAILIR